MINDKEIYLKENYYKKSNQEIADEIGSSETSVRRLAHKLGLEKKNVFKKLLEEKQFNNPDNWNYGWVKTPEASVFVSNERPVIRYEDVRDNLINEMKRYAPKYPKIKRGKSKNDEHLLVLDPADIHINKLCLLEETNDDYNTQIAIQRVKQAVDEILYKAENYNIEKILLVIGNDVLNTDNKSGTTAGTPQDMDTLWHKAFKEARKMYVDIIEKLIVRADVHIVYNPSNHDYYSGFMLADALYCWFRQNKNVTWDISIIHRKYFTYGNNLIGTSHGDGAKEADLPMLMATEAKDWSIATNRYFFLHHIHHKKQIKYIVGDKNQITIEYLRSPSGTDGWHHRNGYVSKKSIEGFIHHKQNGQVARLSVNF